MVVVQHVISKCPKIHNLNPNVGARGIPVADAGFKERGGCSGGGSPKGGGCGRGMCSLPREARKLLKTLIRCAKMHEKITSFFYLCRILRIM